MEYPSAETVVFTDISSADAYSAVLDRKHSEESLRRICDFWPQQRGGAIDERGNTLLHFLAIYDNTVALERLLEKGLLTSQDLWKANQKGNTPLHDAARLGWTKFARILRDKDEDLVLARNHKGETPIYVAVKWGHGEVFCLFYEKLRSESAITRFDGRTVLHAAVTEDYYPIAIRIVHCFPGLANKADEQGTTALHLLARKPSSFFSGSSYYRKNLGSWPFIPLQILGILFYMCLPTRKTYEGSRDDEENQDHQIESHISQQSKLVSVFGAILRAFPRVGRIDNAKQKHTLAVALVKLLVVQQEEDWISSVSSKNPLIEASRNGIIEIVREILDKFPYVAYSFDEFGKNLLHIAVEQKDQTLYDYLSHNIAFKDMRADVDNDGNTVLHLATKLGTSPRVLLGNLNQMTWDVCWFKRVFYDSMPHFLNMKNKKGKTPKELFKESHGPLEKTCEKTLKDMNNGLMLVAALIGAVNYAALFTIPGGYDQDSKKTETYGLPVLYEKGETKEKLTYFLWYICLALFGSLMALISMLSIQLSPFRSSDFHTALPFRFLVAMTSLFWAALYTILSCLLAFTLDTLKHDSLLFLWLSVIAIALLYTDTICMTVVYMYCALRYSFYKKGQEILDLI